MINKFLPSFAAASLLLLGACSTSKLAHQDYQDDVYHSVAKAKEIPAPAERQSTAITEENTTEYVTADSNRDQDARYTSSYDNDRYSSYEDDRYSYYDEFDYATRINRFHRYSPWRNYYDWTYYDPFYSYSYNYPYYYHSHRYYRYRPGINVNIYIGSPNWYDPFYPRYYYGYGYGYPYHRWGGAYSYYNTYPGYHYGRPSYASPNYRPRPSRGLENMPYSRPSTSRDDGRSVVDSRTRTERYRENESGRSSSGYSRPETSTSTPRPTRESARPTRTEPQRSNSGNSNQGSSRPTRTERYTPPPAPSTSDGSSSSGSERSNNGSSSSARPKRGN